MNVLRLRGEERADYFLVVCAERGPVSKANGCP